MRPYLQLIRGGNVLVSLGGTVIAGLAARGAGIPLQTSLLGPLLLAGLSTGLVTAAGNVLNDLGDRDSDRTNHPDRPLVTGAVSIRAAQRLTIALFVGSGLAITPIILSAPLLAVIWVGALVALLSYEFRLKAGGLGGNAAVAFLTGAVFLYGGAAVGNVAVVLPFALMAFAATLSREIIKDM
ncbi:MAG: UbiA family prenyltransferase, partial [Thermoplasmata archaeon]|nr:UbiA family prenyltransferase [Thermoplasmata archaeon]